MDAPDDQILVFKSISHWKERAGLEGRLVNQDLFSGKFRKQSEEQLIPNLGQETRIWDIFMLPVSKETTKD